MHCGLGAYRSLRDWLTAQGFSFFPWTKTLLSLGVWTICLPVCHPLQPAPKIHTDSWATAYVILYMLLWVINGIGVRYDTHQEQRGSKQTMEWIKKKGWIDIIKVPVFDIHESNRSYRNQIKTLVGLNDIERARVATGKDSRGLKDRMALGKKSLFWHRSSRSFDHEWPSDLVHS